VLNLRQTFNADDSKQVDRGHLEDLNLAIYLSTSVSKEVNTIEDGAKIESCTRNSPRTREASLHPSHCDTSERS
jgi:hypothetical protein